MIKRILDLPVNNSFFLFGPRQVGKSTLVKKTFNISNTYIFDLLKTEEYMRLKANPNLFREEVLSRNKKIQYIVVDEVQRIPELLNEVHYILESTENPPCFILTGSSARKLKRANANLLAGRAWTLSMFPLTYFEIKKENNFVLDKALSIGTLPKVYLANNDNSAQQTLRSYVETYLKEEIEAEALLRSTGTFLRFLFLSGHESGNTLNYSSIAREAGTSHTTVKEYFQILEDTLLGFMLFPYSKSIRKRLSKHPKFYFFDTGIQRTITKKLNLKLEPKTYEYGRLFEHWIINETYRINKYYNKDFELSYVRTENGVEIDLILETPTNKILCIEIKSTDTPSTGKISRSMSMFEDSNNIEKMCVCTAPRKRKVNELLVLPWQEYLSYIKELE